MSFTLWRIGVDAPECLADDLTGKGAGGRWNRKGRRVLYMSTSIALACLEAMVHLRQRGLPLNRYLVKLGVPRDTWDARKTKAAAHLPVG